MRKGHNNAYAKDEDKVVPGQLMKLVPTIKRSHEKLHEQGELLEAKAQQQDEKEIVPVTSMIEDTAKEGHKSKREKEFKEGKEKEGKEVKKRIVHLGYDIEAKFEINVVDGKA